MKWLTKRRLLAVASTLLLGLLALLAGVVYFLGSPEFERFAADAVVGFIAERTGARVTLESLDADFRRQRFVLSGLVLRGDEDPSEQPLASVSRIEIGFRFRALLSRQVDLSHLVVERPEIALSIGPDGASNVPSPPSRAEGGSIPVELLVGELTVSDGGLQVNENRVNMDFDLSEVNGRFDYAEETRILSGRLEYSGELDRLDAPLIPYDLSAEFDYTAGTVLLRSVSWESEATRLSFQGRIDDIPGQRETALAYTGVVDLPFLNYFFRNENFQGSVDVDGTLDFRSGQLTTSGRFSSEHLSVDDWVASDVAADYEYGFPERHLEARNLQANVAGGRVRGTARVLPLPGPSRVELDLRYQDIDTAQLERVYPWNPEYLIDSKATGTLTGWLEGKFRDFELSGDASLIPADVPFEPGSFPSAIEGFTEFFGTPGDLTITNARARFGSTRVGAEGRISGEESLLEVQLESGDLGDLAFLSDLANGSGTFDGVLSGNLARPAVEGDFTLSGYAYEEWLIDRIEGYASLVGGALEVNGVHVFEGASELVVEGRYDLERDEPDLELTLVRVEGEVIRAVSGRPLDGVASGEARLMGLDPLEVEGLLRVEDLTYDGRLVGSASGGIIWNRSAVRLTDVSVRNGAESLDGQGVFELEAQRLDVQLQVSGQRLEELDWLGVPSDLGGTVREAAFEVGGTLSEPSVNGRAVIDGLRFRQQRFRQAVIEVSDATGLMHVEVETDSRLQLEADVGVYEAGLPFTGLARLREYDGAGWIEGLSGGLTVTGDVRFEGSLNDVTALRGTGQIERFTTLIDDQELNVTRPFRFRFDTEDLEFIDPLTIDGDATSINVSGRIGVSPDAPLDLRINGVVDLAELSPAGAAWTSGGMILLGGEIQGDLANPQLSGLANLQGVSLGHSTLPISLSALNGDLYFDRSRIDINNIRGTAGGGQVLISGATNLEGTTPGAFDILLDVSDIGVRAQSGLRMEFGGELYLRGTRADARLEGDIELESFTFNQPFEAFLGLFGSGVQTGESGGALDDLALGIHVQGNRNIRVENELVRVESRVDLDLGGTFGDPSLTGRVEVSQGTLNFQRNRYRITRGNVDFVDPIQIEPLVDVEAETELRDYRIILTISGRGDDFQLSMRSDPPLSELEIVSLIAGGRARDEFSDDQGGLRADAPTSEQLFQSGAGTILADLLQERVGSRLGVLNSVRVDPFLVGAENDPVARVTVSEQITRDLTITYSQDLSSNSQQIIQIEYFLNSDTSFIASRDETGALGLDIRLRRRFR